MLTNNPFFKLSPFLTPIAMPAYAVPMLLLVENGTVPDTIGCLSV